LPVLIASERETENITTLAAELEKLLALELEEKRSPTHSGANLTFRA
jgi:hypothetical protein